MKQSSVIFISGTGRSGTNITKAILDKHSRCATLPFEYRFSIDPGGLIDFLNQYSSTWSPFMADKRLREFESYLKTLASRNEDKYAMSQWLKKTDSSLQSFTPFPYAGWELEKWMPGYQKHVDKLIEQLVDFKYEGVWPGSDGLSEKNTMYFGKPYSKDELTPIIGEFLTNCIDSFLKETDKNIFVEDNTWSILFAEDLFRLIPNALMLHIMRDPRDVIASLIKQRWTPSNLEQVLIWYESVFQKWKSQKSNLLKNQYMEVRIEDLCSNSESIINDICSFASIPFEPNMLNLDLSKTNSGRYKNEFTPEEIDTIESRLRPILEQYNYL